MDVRVEPLRRLSTKELVLSSCGAGEDASESLRQQGDQTNQSYRRSTMNIHWKDWCWSWNSNRLATWCKELTYWKGPWCWVRLKAGGEGDDRGWDGWMASPTWWTWVRANSGSWWWTVRSGVLQSMGSQRVRQDWTTKLNWTILYSCNILPHNTQPQSSHEKNIMKTQIEGLSTQFLTSILQKYKNQEK